jgi:hypothetical protein
MAISLIPFDRLDFRTLGYPQNGAPFSPPIFGGRIPMLSRKLLVREVILAEQVEVLPGNRRAMATASRNASRLAVCLISSNFCER